MTLESTVVNTMRGLMNVLHPLTGDTRAEMTLTMTSAPGTGTFLLKHNAWLFPVLGGGAGGPLTQRPDLLFKTTKNPAREDGLWQVTETGNPVTIISNIAGIRHNMQVGTRFAFDFPTDGILSMTVASVETLATDPPEAGHIQSMSIYEEAEKDFFLDLRRTSFVGKFPAVIVNFDNIMPGDGATSSTLNQGSKIAPGTSLYRMDMIITIFSARDDTDARRRLEGLTIADGIMRYLTDRRWSDDNDCVSNPGGLEVLQMFPNPDDQQPSQKFYIYTIRVAATFTLARIDDRVYNPWLTAYLSTELQQDPTEVNQGDLPMVTDMVIQMADDNPELILDGTAATLTGWWVVDDRTDGLSPAIAALEPKVTGTDVIRQTNPVQQPTLTKLRRQDYARIQAAPAQHFAGVAGSDLWAAAATELSTWFTGRITSVSGYLLSITDGTEVADLMSLEVSGGVMTMTLELAGGPVLVAIDYEDPNEHLFLIRLTAGVARLIIDGNLMGEVAAPTGMVLAGVIPRIGTDLALTATLDGVARELVTAAGLVPEAQDSRMTTYLMGSAGL